MADIRIISDGTTQGTRVFNTKTGEEIPGVYKAEWSLAVDGKAMAILYVHNVGVDVIATEATTVKQNISPGLKTG
jgi:hypothetical protein